jgi:membrane-bound serine protease (ClpP class)
MMKSLVSLLLLSFLASTLCAKVIVIPIEKEIEPGLYTFLKRAVKEAEKEKPEAIIFEINTFGGQVETALDIVELITNIKVRTVAYVKEKAISAGALIALSCNDILMQEHTTIGDVAPIMVGQEGPVMMGEKFQSPLRAKFRSLAQKNNYPVKLSEAFVSTDKEIVEVVYINGEKKLLTGVEYADLTAAEKETIVKKKTIVPKGELLTLSASEAEELGFSRRTVKSMDEALDFLKVKSREIVRIDKRRSEQFLIFMNKVAPLLILIGLFGIYMEIKTPGFGFFGILGIAAFAIFFGTKYIVGLADHIEVLLFILGLAFLFIEIFLLPGHGFIAVTGITLMLISVLLAMQSFVVPKMPWDYTLFKRNLLVVGSMFAVSVPLFIIALFSASRLVLFTRLGHKTSEQTSEGFAPAEDYSALVGKKGQVVTTLRPAGIVEIDGRPLDVVSDSEFIEKGEPVQVIETVGNRIVVRKTT